MLDASTDSVREVLSFDGGIVPEQPLFLRDGRLPERLVVIRLGTTTLEDDKLHEQCERAFLRWGVNGFSVFEVPNGDYEALGRLAPIVTVRRKLFEARGRDLLESGFPLLPTADHPHWTVVLSEPRPVQFERVRSCFRGPIDNPAYVEPR